MVGEGRGGRERKGGVLDLRRGYVTPFLDWAGSRSGKLQSKRRLGSAKVIRECGPSYLYRHLRP